jgi:cholesterol oxidase
MDMKGNQLHSSPDAIVIGSGFGGAVSACRLAESGRRVLVLERGPHRKGDDFPRLPDSGPSGWLWNSRWNGLFDFRIFGRIATLSSSGLGGGSHVYANVLIRAPEISFREGWPAGFCADTLAPHYARVEQMLAGRPFPETLRVPKQTAFQTSARTANATMFHPNLAVYFGDGPEPVAPPLDQEPVYVQDPHGLGIDTSQAPCRHCGECDIGCRFASKNTLDLNYLAVAEQRHGAMIRPLCEVYALSQEANGYRVYYRDRNSGERESVWAPLVVLSAGTVNTNELLLRSRDEYGMLPKLSTMLGEHFSGNGDFFAASLDTSEELHPWLGPVITTAIEYVDGDKHFYVEEGGFPPELAFLVGAMHPRSGYFGKLFRGPVSHAVRLRWFYREVARLHADRDALADRLPANSMILLGIGQDASDGRITLKKRLGRRPALDIEWDHTRTLPLIERMEAEFRWISDQLGGSYTPHPLWRSFGRLITVHPLGGCGIADSADEGVLTPFGEVWNYPNLFVADGAAVPRSIGSNPALSIAALAERTAEYIVRRG